MKSGINDHMVPFTLNGKKYAKNMDTGKVSPVADIDLPSMNELSYGAEADESKPSKRQEKQECIPEVSPHES